MDLLRTKHRARPLSLEVHTLRLRYIATDVTILPRGFRHTRVVSTFTTVQSLNPLCTSFDNSGPRASLTELLLATYLRQLSTDLSQLRTNLLLSPIRLRSPREESTVKFLFPYPLGAIFLPYRSTHNTWLMRALKIRKELGYNYTGIPVYQ